MITPPDITSTLPRVTWRDGQALLSRDLGDDLRGAERFRRLHLRYLHRTWGIVEGLELFALAGAVLVTEGSAIDTNGCEILQPLPTRVAAPANIIAETTMYLVLWRAPAPGGCGPGADRAALCPGVANSAPLQQGELAWKPLGAVRPGLDILLARVLVIAGHLASELDTTVQHRARTMNQPRIWSDTTQPGQTGWSDGSDAGGLQLRANVDATSGGFIATPAYFARLAGAAPTSMGCITAAAPGGFAFAVRVAGGGPPINAAQAESKGWTVAWFAVELQPNAEPET